MRSRLGGRGPTGTPWLVVMETYASSRASRYSEDCVQKTLTPWFGWVASTYTLRLNRSGSTGRRTRIRVAYGTVGEEIRGRVMRCDA
jgi:hypothetical protein